jgi:hypothetical protein
MRPRACALALIEGTRTLARNLARTGVMCWLKHPG